MKRHPAVWAGLFAAALFLSAVPAEAGKTRFHFSFGFGYGAGPHYAYGHAGIHRGFVPRVYGSYAYRSWYRAPVVRYYRVPYSYRVYPRYVPRPRATQYAPGYDYYVPRRYVRPVRRH